MTVPREEAGRAPRRAPGGGADGRAARDALTPALYVVSRRRIEADGVVTVVLDPMVGEPAAWLPGQFAMLTAFGVGEVAISMSGVPGDGGGLRHTIRDVGAVTHALCGTPVGSPVGVRGAFGIPWGVEELADTDVVVVAGGIGLAPVRGAIYVLAGRSGGGRLSVAVGARSPEQVIFADDLRAWRESGAEVELTVDAAPPGWRGSVGLVTTALSRLAFDPRRAAALVCGPEIMMRLVARHLVDQGLDPDRIRVSLERNMQCGVGLCGHCQLGPFLLCRDGPVRPFAGVAGVLAERER